MLPDASPGVPRRVAGGRFRIALVALLGSLLALPGACSAPGAGTGAGSGLTASGGAAAAGDRLLVRLYDARHEVRLELSNESNPDFADVYSREQRDAALKLAPDQLLGELVADLDTLGFDRLSASGQPPAAGARAWVEIRKDGASRTFAVPEKDATAEQLTAFANMKLTVNEYYTHVSGLQFIDNPKGAALLKDGQHRGGK
ncbi:MAG TPA: hypothetical protein VK824_11700 [Planctomycetota bacterium]|nr:hypothetical protein [Planctomycetota bacterium]